MCPQLQVPHLAPGMNPPHSDTDDTYDADEEDSGTIRTRRGAQTSVPTAGDPRAAPGPNGEVRGIVSLWSRFSPRTLLSTGLGIASIALYISDSVILPIPPKWHDAFQVTAPSKVGGVKAWRYLLSRVRASRVLPSRVNCNEFAFSGQNGVI